MLDENKVAALEEMAMSITRLAGSVQDLVTQGQARMPASCKCTIAPLDPHENLRDAMVESEAYERDRAAAIETEMDAIAAADARLAEKSRVCEGCGLTYLRTMGHICATRSVVKEKDRPSGIDWQQKISSALGCRIGEMTYPLEDCVDRIKAMVIMLDNVSVRCDLCGDWHGYRDAEHVCRPKEAPVDNMIQKECQYCGHTELLSVDQLGKAQESGEALHQCHIGELIHKALVTNELINVYDGAADFDHPTRWLSYQFHKQSNGIKSPLALRRMLQLTGPQFQYLVGVYSKTRKVNPTDIKQARDKYPSE